MRETIELRTDDDKLAEQLTVDLPGGFPDVVVAGGIAYRRRQGAQYFPASALILDQAFQSDAALTAQVKALTAELDELGAHRDAAEAAVADLEAKVADLELARDAAASAADTQPAGRDIPGTVETMAGVPADGDLIAPADVPGSVALTDVSNGGVPDGMMLDTTADPPLEPPAGRP